MRKKIATVAVVAAALVISCCCCEATQGLAQQQQLTLAPWLGRPFEWEPSLSAIAYAYRSIDTSDGSRARSAVDFVGQGAVAVAIYDYCDISLQLTALLPRYGSSGYESSAITGRYLWLNDAVGDVFSLTTGLSFRNVAERGVRNFALFRHKRNEVEGHIAFGKELQQEGDQWASRCWAAAALGGACHSAAWFTATAAVERQWLTGHLFALTLALKKGLGSRNIESIHHFHGYSHINYRCAEAAIAYTKRFDNFSTLSLSYGYQFFARNSPECLSAISFHYALPFGL